MTTDEAKDEVLRLIGPVGQLLDALRKRGLKPVECTDDHTVLTIQFLLQEISWHPERFTEFWWSIEQILTLCGENVKLKLTLFQHVMHSGGKDDIQYLCTAKFIWLK